MAVPDGQKRLYTGCFPQQSAETTLPTWLDSQSCLPWRDNHPCVPAAHFLLHMQRVSTYTTRRENICFTFCAGVLPRWMVGLGYCFTSVLAQNWSHGNGNMQKLCLKPWDSEPGFERIKWLVLTENSRNLEYKHFLKCQRSFSRHQNKILNFSDLKKLLA